MVAHARLRRGTGYTGAMRCIPKILIALALFGCCAPQLVRAPEGAASDAGSRAAKGGLVSEAQAKWRCVHVVDGDTMDVELGEVKVRVRLLGIDTPERGQPGYKEAAESLRGLALGREVRLERPIGANGKPERDTDKYGRLLRRVWVGDIDLSAAQLEAGHAREYHGGKR